MLFVLWVEPDILTLDERIAGYSSTLLVLDGWRCSLPLPHDARRTHALSTAMAPSAPLLVRSLSLLHTTMTPVPRDDGAQTHDAPRECSHCHQRQHGDVPSPSPSLPLPLPCDAMRTHDAPSPIHPHSLPHSLSLSHATRQGHTTHNAPRECSHRPLLSTAARRRALALSPSPSPARHDEDAQRTMPLANAPTIVDDNAATRPRPLSLSLSLSLSRAMQ
ncbi:hypothetical protein OG21DRAFT_1484995 [Imleria badia]|nr:hypothetical protein OG21DRAFT_1484995 [Imleria badia]